MSSKQELPNLAGILGPLLARVDREHRPLFIALAERRAAERYREWAAACDDEARRGDLLACAEREIEIARRVEALYPDAAAVQDGIVARDPDLADLGRRLFASLPLADQYRVQAQGERAGASTWRSFAEHAEPPARETFLACAELEERSAEVLDAILRENP